MSDISTLSPTDAEWLEETFARNRARFGGFFMGPEDDDAASSDDEPDETDDDAEGSDDDDSDDADDKDVDWKAKFEAQQRINRNLERRTRKDAARIKQLTGGKSDDDKGKSDDKAPDPEKIREEARAEAAREVLHSRIEDKIEAKARSFADPEDAVAVLLRSHDHDDFLDDDNKIDVEAIADALKELGEKKPHLLAQGGRFQGGADGGARKDKPTRPKSLGEAIARNYKS